MGLLNHPFPKKQPLSSPYTPAVFFCLVFFFFLLYKKRLSLFLMQTVPKKLGTSIPLCREAEMGPTAAVWEAVASLRSRWERYQPTAQLFIWMLNLKII